MPTGSPKSANFQRVLLLTDFSAHARAAARNALELLRPSLANLVVAHVLPTPLLGEDLGRLRAGAREKMAGFLSDALPGIPCQAIFDRGPLAEAVPAIAESYCVDLMVAGAGQPGGAALAIGSAAAEIFGAATRPLLTVAAGVQAQCGSGLVLFVSDLSRTADVGAEVAAAFAARRGAELVLLHVVRDGEDQQELARRASTLAARLNARLPLQANAMHSVFDHGDPVETIVADAVSLGASLIVMAVHDSERAFSLPLHEHFAIARRLLARAPCPVLTTRALAQFNPGKHLEIEWATQAATA